MAAIGQYQSFSDLVDVCMQRALRPNADDLLHAATAAVNSTIKQVNATGLYKRATVEDRISDLNIEDETGTYVWQRPRTFHQMGAVSYRSPIGRGDELGRVYPTHREPGKRNTVGTTAGDFEEDTDAFYYYSGDSIVFSGVGRNSRIDLIYYERPRNLPYYPEGERPARWDVIDFQWEYPLGARTQEQQEKARNISMNWVLENWYELVQEGALAKIANIYGDPERAKRLFSSFKDLIKDVPNYEQIGHTEVSQLEGQAGG